MDRAISGLGGFWSAETLRLARASNINDAIRMRRQAMAMA
jgi:hypothetical protein